MTKESYDALYARVQTLTDLIGLGGIASWDMQTHMPPRGAPVRGERLATLTTIFHERSTSEELGELIDSAEDYVREQGEESLAFANWRQAKRQYDRLTVIPTELAAEQSRAASQAQTAWLTARKNNDYASFKPFLKRNIEITLQIVELSRSLFPDAKEDYDILLDDFEQGITTSDVAEVFDAFKIGARPLVEKVAAHAGDGRDSIVHQHFPAAAQEALVREIAHQVGFNDDEWNLTTTAHPFEHSMSIHDIRITNKYEEDFLNPAVFGTLHEFGHGLYENQIDDAHERTILGRGVSMAWHESQSRSWENLVGRGLPFWQWATPIAQRHFPEQLAHVTPEEIYRAVNVMEPSLIRIEADELTYNYHIIIRFELERALLAGDVTVDDLPEAWNAKYKDYLGVDVPSDSDGVLQDVHWAGGSIGYFPTYALGNILGAMVWEKVTSDLPTLSDEIAAGEFGSLRSWFREHIHQYGGFYTPNDLLFRVLGTRKLDAQPQLNYLTAKVNELYG